MATPNRRQSIMNKIAANPLTITTGRYWLIEPSTANDCLAKTGARKPKFPITASDMCRKSGQEAGQCRLSQLAVMSRIQAGMAEQHQQPCKRVNHVRRGQPRLA